MSEQQCAPPVKNDTTTSGSELAGSISAICTRPPLAVGGAAVITILIQFLPPRSSACARVRTTLPVTGGPIAVQSPSTPLVELDDTSKW